MLFYSCCFNLFVVKKKTYAKYKQKLLGLMGVRGRGGERESFMKKNKYYLIK
jgi:hypothetical protein